MDVIIGQPEALETTGWAGGGCPGRMLGSAGGRTPVVTPQPVSDSMGHLNRMSGIYRKSPNG